MSRLYIVLTDQRGVDILKLAGTFCETLPIPRSSQLAPPPAVGPGASIDVLEFTIRTANALRAEGVVTVSDLAAKTKQELLLVPNMGRKSVGEIEETLLLYGYHLATEQKNVNGPRT